MLSLTDNQRSFIVRMKKSEEHERRGFELLLKRTDFDEFFDELAANGMFDPEKNPSPVSAGDNLFRIPYWAALAYLVGCARKAGETFDLRLAEKVLGVVRSVSAHRDLGGSVRDNYHTFREFAEILGLVPTSAIATSDADLIPIWLSSKFYRDGVASALDKGAIPRLLASTEWDDHLKANSMLRHCLVIEWRQVGTGTFETEEPAALIDPYWLDELLRHHAREFGRKLGVESAMVLHTCVREAFGRGGRAKWSYVFRPAVEDHGQNQPSPSVENCAVDGLRELLLGWCEVAVENVKAFVRDLINSDNQMLRRIGIYVISERWSELGDIYSEVVAPELFDIGHIHELHRLLHKHFSSFPNSLKEATLDAIAHITVPVSEDAGDILTSFQRRWLTALAGSSYAPATKWLQALNDRSEFGLSDHPDFNSYHQMAWGAGPSPYQVSELVTFAEQGLIVDRLNSFTSSERWRGPSKDGLVRGLTEAVEAAPEVFVRVLPLFVDAEQLYQNGIIAGFRHLWDMDPNKYPELSWDYVWPKLFAFFATLIDSLQKSARDPSAADVSTIATIADFLRAGSSDEHAYPAELLAQGWAILETLLERAPSKSEVSNDPMMQAINAPRGRVIEAIFHHVLRECRVEDKLRESHDTAWLSRRPLFDRELGRCKNGNYEFSTLAAAYIVNLDYVNAAWLKLNVSQIFPADSPDNFFCAVGGLSYAGTSRRTYSLLRDEGVLDRALRSEGLSRDTRKRLVERTALAYLWNDESLESPRFAYLFDRALVDELGFIAWFFWSIRGPKLSADQRGKIIAFWSRCAEWAASQTDAPRTLMARLGDLACYLDAASGPNRTLLLSVAPYVNLRHGADGFIAELLRLVETDPADVNAVLRKMLDASHPSNDYDDRLRALVERLARLGYRKEALDYCDELRALPGLAQLFIELRSSQS